LCQGRGSAANSLVAYLLDITPIDPLSAGMVFERFLSRERTTAPDIDLDFAADRREEAIQYLYSQYGHDHVAMACTVSTFGARQAIRDVGMVLGFPDETLDRVSESIDAHNASSLPNSSTFSNSRYPSICLISAFHELNASLFSPRLGTHGRCSNTPRLILSTSDRLGPSKSASSTRLFQTQGNTKLSL
jgi:hypothetical protein